MLIALRNPVLMRKAILTISLPFLFFWAYAQNTDLPGPTPNLQTLPAGSYVIAMDNTLQVNSSGDFNLKAYGLIVYLLNNNVHVKWSIKAGKAKDGVDFTANAEQLKPTLVAGGTSRNFKAGPFVIFANDTSGVASLIDAFYTSNSITGSNRPQVYRLTADASNADIRYDLTGFRPKVAVLTDGGNQSIHLAYITAASIPSESYATSQGTDLLTNCFTFASEPHNTNSGTAVNNAISAIKDFVTKGGNFLAQCEAINNYENNSLGRFQATGGITISNTNIGTTLTYSNPDLSFSQYEGSYNASAGGSLKNWKFVGTTTNNEHDHATGTGTNTSVIGASVSKHYYDKGGLVFYVGNHSFATTSLAGINGIRMYMNAFLTPSNTNCPELLFIPLGLRITQFSGNHQNGKTGLSWTVANNDQVKQFAVEKSIDGANFSFENTMLPTTKSGIETYQYFTLQSTAKTYYRIKVTDKEGKSQYSPALSFSKDNGLLPHLSVLNTAYSDDVLIGYYTNKNDKVALYLYNSSGSIIYSGNVRVTEGMNVLSVPAFIVSKQGLYFIETINKDGVALKAKILMQSK
jgi:hypothetical protein